MEIYQINRGFDYLLLSSKMEMNVTENSNESNYGPISLTNADYTRSLQLY